MLDGEETSVAVFSPVDRILNSFEGHREHIKLEKRPDEIERKYVVENALKNYSMQRANVVALSSEERINLIERLFEEGYGEALINLADEVFGNKGQNIARDEFKARDYNNPVSLKVLARARNMREENSKKV